MPADSPNRSSPVLLVIAWLVVGIPAAWGVAQTVTKSLDLFKSPGASTTSRPVK